MSQHKKNILYIIASTQLGGAEYFIYYMLEYLNRDRYVPFVACPSNGPMADMYKRSAADCLILDSENLLDPRIILKVREFVNKNDIDIVHSILYTSDVCAVFAVLFNRAKHAVATIAGFNFGITDKKGFKKLKHMVFSLVYRFIYKFSSKVVAVASAVKKDLSNRQGIKLRQEDIDVIYCGIPGERRQSADAEVEKELVRYHILPGSPVIISIGTLHYVKGHAYLIEAMIHVLKVMPQAKLILIGDGPERQNLEKMIKGHGIEESVKLTGYLDEDIRERMLSRSDLLVLPSLTEGCPTVILESMRASKPVVATDVGGVRELMEDGKTGFIVPSRDPDGIADKVIAILSDESTAKRFGEEALERFKEKFTAKAMIDAYCGIYEKLNAETE